MSTCWKRTQNKEEVHVFVDCVFGCIVFSFYNCCVASDKWNSLKTSLKTAELQKKWVNNGDIAPITASDDWGERITDATSSDHNYCSTTEPAAQDLA